MTRLKHWIKREGNQSEYVGISDSYVDIKGLSKIAPALCLDPPV